MNNFVISIVLQFFLRREIPRLKGIWIFNAFEMIFSNPPVERSPILQSSQHTRMPTFCLEQQWILFSYFLKVL